MKESGHKKYVLAESFDFTNSIRRAEFFSLILSFSEEIVLIPVMLNLRKSARRIYKINISEIKERIKSTKEITYLKIYAKNKSELHCKSSESVPAVAINEITRITILEEKNDGKGTTERNL